MVWTHNKISRTCKDDPAGHCTRGEKERQTEKETGRQHYGVDGLKLVEALRTAENKEEWRTVVARSSLVPQRSTRLRIKCSEVKISTRALLNILSASVPAQVPRHKPNGWRVLKLQCTVKVTYLLLGFHVAGPMYRVSAVHTVPGDLFACGGG